MILKEFHSSVSTWFNQTFRAPSEIQVQAWPQIRKNKNTLISAPTGSGKTLAAFLEAIDSLIQQGLTGKLSNETQIVYVSPLKALSNDIHKNLQLPIQGIEKIMEDQGLPRVKIRVMVRTGDTPTSQRTAMIKNPPHILVTTPESLYLLLTSENGRKMLATTRTVIIDEIHALVGNKRGSHLSLSLERLSRLTPQPPLRIGLSATQRPIEKVAKFLVGGSGQPNCKILDAGHQRKIDLALEIPRSPLTAVMANEVWEEIHQRLEELILQHHTTLIFVNTRSLTERLAHHLTERLGSEMITAHHGSMSKEHRLEAEQNLKEGKLRALVATASLELGIDIGSVDLVCQLGSPKSIATFLQRVGRSGHSVDGTPKGRLFPLSRDELVESVAILDAIRRGELDKIVMPEKPLDVLAQQIIAETSNQEYHEDELYNMVKNAYPYRNLEKDEFSNLLQMMADGFSPRQGRRRAHIYRDLVHRTVKGRKGARLTALISGGTIPDQFDYDVILEPSSTYIGSLNEDFAIESMPGDIFQLGNNSWRILRVETGKVRVQDAHGLPPSMPFWLGEAPGRTIELSQAVSFLREEISDRLGDLEHLPGPQEDGDAPSEQWKNEALKWLTQDVKISEAAADQVVTYLGISKAALGVMPSHKNIVLERFFDEVGDMHLVIHSCFGSRLNRAWGLALRKRFCRKFNFELQAAANEDAIVLSLGATHSFPLEEVFSYLNPKTVRNVLVQALLDAPMFNVRWRWNASTALAIQRRRGGVRVPPQIQRSQAEDLIALVFPDQLACLENISGEREVPDHPLVLQTIHDCLYEAMDIEELEKLLTDLRAGKLNLVAKDLREPSPMSQEILNARPYTFLDNAPLEERRTNAIKNRKWLDPSEAKELSHLDEAAIEAVKTESWPQITSPEELHDTLILFGFITEEEGNIGSNGQNWEQYLIQLIASGQATTLKIPNLQKIWVALERTEQFNLVFDQPKYQPELKISEELQKTLAQNNKCTDPMAALVEIIRGRLEALGPVTIEDLVASLGLPMEKIDQALVLLENDGFVFRGNFTPGLGQLEWCERRLLARINRYTLKRLRKEIEPVSPNDFMRFLFEWQHLNPLNQPEGPQALQKVLEQLEGVEAPAAAWESHILPSRIKDYDYLWLDVLCMSGKIIWGRFRPFAGNSNHLKGPTPIKTTPITLVDRNNLQLWSQLSDRKNGEKRELSDRARQIWEFLKQQGASFFNDLMEKNSMLKIKVEEAISELVSHGLVTSDSFTGLRALLVPTKYRLNSQRRRKKASFEMEEAGRWSLIDRPETNDPNVYELNQQFCQVLLRRYGVIFRKLAEQESMAPPWRELVKVLRRMEAKGQIRGGRFVNGVWGEQYALPEAIVQLRKARRAPKKGTLIAISAADPLNLIGIITPGRKIPAYLGNRILFKDGEAIVIKENKELNFLKEPDQREKWKLQNALIQRNISPRLRAYLGRGIS